MIDRFRLWLAAASPLVRDLAVAVGCFVVVSPLVAAVSSYSHSSIALSLAAFAVSCVPLVARSRRPLAVVTVVVAIYLLQFAALPLARPTPAAAAVALHALAMRHPGRLPWQVGAGAAAAFISASLIFRPGQENLPQSLALITWTLMAVAVGDAVRSRREVLAATVERAERAERTKEEEAHSRVTAERLRVARELHDVVAHHITLVNAQAGVAHHLMHTDAEHAYQALERIRDTSRAALDELRATVGLLRYGEDTVEPREPAPGLAGLDDMVDSFRHAGLTITLERTGDPGELLPITDLTAYRIIQEALTNTRKHAGPTTARVRLAFRTDVLRVTVEDDGPGAPGDDGGPGSSAPFLDAAGAAGTGHGMIGMRERVKAAGGTLTAGPHHDGGFRIAAELPLRAGRKG